MSVSATRIEVPQRKSEENKRKKEALEMDRSIRYDVSH